MNADQGGRCGGRRCIATGHVQSNDRRTAEANIVAVRDNGLGCVAKAAGIAEIWRRWSLLLELQKGVQMADVEIVARVERRRTWSAEAKAALVAESAAGGGEGRLGAGRHRIAGRPRDAWRPARAA